MKLLQDEVFWDERSKEPAEEGAEKRYFNPKVADIVNISLFKQTKPRKLKRYVFLPV